MISLTLGVALAAYLIGSAFAVTSLVRIRSSVGLGTVLFSVVGLGAHTASLGLACVAHGGWPLGVASESISFIAWGLVALGCVIAWRYSAGPLLAFSLPLGAILSTVALLRAGDRLAVATFGVIPRGGWLWTHIALMLLAVAALALAGLSGILYLLQEHELKSRRPGGLLRRLPSLEVCDLLGYRALAMSFVLLSAGLLAGAVEAWLPGSVGWTWDLTKVLAVSIWAIVVVLLYGRWAIGWRGRKAAYLAVAGTLSVTGLLIGVLLLAGRFHPLG